MKMSIKRLLIMAQVLGLSALAATACTKNASETKPADTTAKKDDTSKKSTDASVNNSETSSTTKTTELGRSTLVNQSKVVKDTDENKTFHTQLLNIGFNKILVSDLIPCESSENANGLIKALPDLFPVSIENDQGEATTSHSDATKFLDKYETQIIEGGVSSDNQVSPPSAIDDSKKSIDGENKGLDPNQAKAPKTNTQVPPVKK